jgi:apolipoprotein N-acyltransferase
VNFTLLVAAALAVLLEVLAFPPADLFPLAFLALAPWCALALRLRGARLFLVGTLTGAAALTFGCFWIRRTDPTNLVLMVVPESLFFGGFALLLRALLVARTLPAALVLPISFTAIEFVRGRWPLDGFPWLSLGYTQAGFRLFAQVADLGGVHLITLLLGVTAGSLVDFFLAARRNDALARGAAAGGGSGRRWRALLPGVGVLVLACGYGAIRLQQGFAQSPGPVLLIVQPNLSQKLKDSGPAAKEVYAIHLDLVERARRAESGPIDLVVWSETMITDGCLEEQLDGAAAERERDGIGRPLVAAVGGPLLTGCLTADGDPGLGTSHRWNSAILFDKDGRRAGQYAKRVLVPGGEYLPWIEYLPDSLRGWIKRTVREEAGFLPDLLPGRHSGIVALPSGGASVAAGLTICFEIAYPHLGRELVRGGAQLLVNLSNEAWFPDTAEFEQYAAMAVLRAIECRRSVVKVANSGESGWISATGERHLLEQDGRRDGFPASAVIRPDVVSERTLYVRLGEWAGAGACVAALALLLFRRRRAASDATAAASR